MIHDLLGSSASNDFVFFRTLPYTSEILLQFVYLALIGLSAQI